MREPIPTERQLFEVYAATIDVLLKCLLISVVVLLVATVILIFLCCWEEVRKNGPARMRAKLNYIVN